MKKIWIIGLIVVFILSLTTVSFAGGRYYGGHRGGGLGHGNAGVALVGLGGLVVGTFIGAALVRSTPPPVYYSPPPPPPPPSAYYPPPSPQGYYLNGAVILVEMKTWYTESIRYTIENELGRHGAAVATSNYRGKIDYVLEVHTGQDGGYNTVRVRLIRAVDGIPCDDATGIASPYYDGSDQERSYAWAAQRAMAKLH